MIDIDIYIRDDGVRTAYISSIRAYAAPPIQLKQALIEYSTR